MNTSVDMLMHGGDIRYIDLDEGELCHWKYIKREKLPNGKWRYYYDYGQYAEADMKKAEADVNRDKQSYQDAVEDSKTARKNFSNALKTLDEKHNEYADKYMSRKKWEKRMASKLKSTERQYNKAVKKYEETPLYKVRAAKSKIDKGAKAITKSLSKAFSKKK